MVDMLARREERLVTRISGVRRDDLELAGGKGANLGELMQAGFSLPATTALRFGRRSRTPRSPTGWPRRSSRRTPTSAGRWQSAPAQPPKI
jgi:hypothetical protein